MTGPHTPTELDGESEDELEHSRITVVVGALLLDVSAPSRVSVSVVVNDVIELGNEQLAGRADTDRQFENTEGSWTFARLTGGAIDPDQSLAEAGVHDGEVLLIEESGVSGSSVMVDEVEGVTVPVDRWTRWLSEHGQMTAWSAISIGLSSGTAMLLPDMNFAQLTDLPIAAIAVLVVGVGCAVIGCVMPYRSGDPAAAARLAGVSLPLIFGGSLNIVPDGHGIQSLPMALGLTALVALIQLLVTGRFRAAYTAVIALALLVAPVAIAHSMWEANPRTVGAVLTTVAVIVVYLAPRVTILLSSLPIPRVPTAGEPLDDIETQGGTAVEGVSAIGKQVIPTEENLTQRIWRATDYLTGIVAAAAIAAVVGSYLAVDVSANFYWQGTALAFAVATVLCLRGRSHHVLGQSAVLIAGGVAIPLVVIVKTAAAIVSWQVNAAVALIVLTAILILCGLIAPAVEFSPVMRRRVEIVEYVAVAFVFPLACWVIGLYAYFRGLRL